AKVQFVLMKEAMKIEYGHFLGAEATMRNYEWGAGFNIYRTWFETNEFGIRMSDLAPVMRYAYFNNVSVQIYATLVAGITTAITAPTDTLVTDLNTAVFELIEHTDWRGQRPFENASFRILAATRASRFLEPALQISCATATEA